jgi:hypothetical protein
MHTTQHCVSKIIIIILKKYYLRNEIVGSTDYVVSLTRWSDLWQWGNIDGDELPQFLFSRQKPKAIDNVEWRLVLDIRNEIGNDVYDNKVRRFFTLFVDDPLIRYSDINVVWDKFMDLFRVFGAIVEYKEAWRDYFRQALEELYDDNVQYLELRSVLPEVSSLKNCKMFSINFNLFSSCTISMATNSVP